MKTKTFLSVERLEARDVPATFGAPWQNPNVTISFAADGTLVDGRPSELSQTMASSGLSDDVWKSEILRAFQAWAQVAGVNVGVVNDGGQAMGAAGATQGDTRFGDVRVFARSLSPEVMAITAPPGIAGDTRTGDVILNSSYRFTTGGNGGPDLFSAMLQEAGHALGVGNSTDPNSPMFERYGGPRAGLTAGDVTVIQSLYGARQADAYEGAAGNNTFNKARTLAAGVTSVAADVTTASDVDYFRFKTPRASRHSQGSDHTLVVWLQSKGRSLLAPQLTVFDRNGNVVGSVASSSPAADDLTVHLTHVDDDEYYYVKIESTSGTAFRTGSYELKVLFDPDGQPADTSTSEAPPLDDRHTDDVITRATQLESSEGFAENVHYLATARLRDAGDVDFYRVRAADNASVVTVTVRSMDGAGFAPLVTVFDKDRREVAATVVANEDGTYSVQVTNVDDNRDYYVRVRSDAGATSRTGTYLLEVNFTTRTATVETLAAGTLSEMQPQAFRTMHIGRSQILNLALSAEIQSGNGNTAVRMTIYDADHNPVVDLVARSGEMVSQTVLLTAGDYTVVFSGGDRNGGSFRNLTFTLQGAVLTDPIGPGAVDASGNPTGGDDCSCDANTAAVDEILAMLYPALNPWS